MGDLVAKAKRELEELYSGVPDDSVNLTFGDLAQVRPNPDHMTLTHSPKTSPPPLHPIKEPVSPRREEVAPLAKLPSLDFSRGLEASAQFNYPSKTHTHHHHHHNPVNYNNHTHHDRHAPGGPPQSHVIGSPYNESHHGMQSSVVYDDMSQMSVFPERGGRRRPGIPHSNICTICSTYIYVFRHRCLVCGRVYCRQCMGIGMGHMPEGRKCIECLGRRFSQRYIQKAGQTGCCMGYSSAVKQQELKWAEKGPRGSGENRHGRSGMMSRPISAPMTPVRAHNAAANNPAASFISNTQQPSFVLGSPYSPYYYPKNHPLPF